MAVTAAWQSAASTLFRALPVLYACPLCFMLERAQTHCSALEGGKFALPGRRLLQPAPSTIDSSSLVSLERASNDGRFGGLMQARLVRPPP